MLGLSRQRWATQGNPKYRHAGTGASYHYDNGFTLISNQNAGMQNDLPIQTARQKQTKKSKHREETQKPKTGEEKTLESLMNAWIPLAARFSRDETTQET